MSTDENEDPPPSIVSSVMPLSGEKDIDYSVFTASLHLPFNMFSTIYFFLLNFSFYVLFFFYLIGSYSILNLFPDLSCFLLFFIWIYKFWTIYIYSYIYMQVPSRVLGFKGYSFFKYRVTIKVLLSKRLTPFKEIVQRKLRWDKVVQID
jgi:hypothetical protein